MRRGLSMVRWGALALAAALGPPRAAAMRADDGAVLERETAAGNQTSPDEVFACWCKPVDSMSDCPDNKYPEEPWKPHGPRYFHAGKPGGEGAGNLCCKLLSTDLFAFAGFDYSKQKDLELCQKDVRAVPATKCCRLSDVHGSMGVRVHSVQSEPWIRSNMRHLHSLDTDPIFALVPDIFGGSKDGDFRKTPPTFRPEDVYAAEDYDGTAVPDESAREFVRSALESGRFGGKPQCGGSGATMQQLFGEDVESCRLREAPTRQCCCNKATLEEVERCLPVEGAATEEEAATRDLESTVTSKKHDHEDVFEDTVVDPPTPDESRMPKGVDGRPDPEQQDLPETPEDDASMLFSWEKMAEQWSSECIDRGYVRTVTTKTETFNYEDGKTCYLAHINRAVEKRCKPIIKTDVLTVYSQGKKGACLKWRMQRRCPAGQGRYRKQIKPGACMGEGEGLERAGPDSLVYTCPAGHESSLAAPQRCSCEGVCR